MHTHPGQPPAGPSGRGSRCGATARAALPAAQTKQSALAVSAAQFQMPRPRAARSLGRGREAPSARARPSPRRAAAPGRPSELLRVGSKWGNRGAWGAGKRERETQRQRPGERQAGRQTDRDRDKGRPRNTELD